MRGICIVHYINASDINCVFMDGISSAVQFVLMSSRYTKVYIRLQSWVLETVNSLIDVQQKVSDILTYKVLCSALCVTFCHKFHIYRPLLSLIEGCAATLTMRSIGRHTRWTSELENCVACCLPALSFIPATRISSDGQNTN